MARKKKSDTQQPDESQDTVSAVPAEDGGDDTLTPENTDTLAAENLADANDTADADATADTPDPDSDAPVTLDEPGEGAATSPWESGSDAALAPEADDTLAPEDDSTSAEGDDSVGAASVEAVPDANETTDPAETSPPPAPAPEQVVVRKGGFFPLLLGGVAAAAIGFGAARYVLPEGWPWPGAQDDGLAQDVAAQSGRIDELASAVEGIDLSGLESQATRNAEQIGSIASRLDEIAGTLSAVQDRLDTLEQRPVAEPGSADATAFSNELRALQQSVDAQRAEIDSLLSEAQAREEAARATAQEALARAALSRIQTALDTGSDFSGAVSDLQEAGIDVPAALAEQAGGVPTMAQLTGAFPEAARTALMQSREATGESEGLGGFLKTQLGVRSLEPQEGDGPDAILSRAEAALREGRLADALAEIAALPEAGQEALSGWVARAETRQAAVTAAGELAQSLNAN